MVFLQVLVYFLGSFVALVLLSAVALTFPVQIGKFLGATLAYGVIFGVPSMMVIGVALWVTRKMPRNKAA